LLETVRNSLGTFLLPNFFEEPSSNLIPTIPSIFNRKAARKHSSFRWALLGPNDLTLDLNWKSSNLIGNSFEINL
jgi:hypothetical protein